MNSSLTIGRIKGIPIGVKYSWFFIFIAVGVLLSLYYFPWRYTDGATVTYWLAGFITSLLFFASVLAHEIAHSLIAIRRGIEVREITLFFLGGFSRITKEPDDPIVEMEMASAGPLSSLLLAILFALIWLPLRNVEPFAALALWLSLINVAMAVFNIVPGFPMDGGRIVRAFIWKRTGEYMRATRISTLVGQMVGYLIMAGGVAMTVIVDPWIRGVWLVIIGLFLRLAASASYKQEILRNNLLSLQARGLIRSNQQWIDPSVTIRDILKNHLNAGELYSLLVGEPGKILGVIDEDMAESVSKQKRAFTNVEDVMTPAGRLPEVAPDDNGQMILEKMEDAGVDFVRVVDDNRVLGIVERDYLLEKGLKKEHQANEATG
jgi:Zn-dependent protease